MTQAIIESLRGAVPPECVTTDPAECDYFAQDVFTRDGPAAAVVHPRSTAELAAAVKAATAAGAAVVARGGGMSYTSGYVPAAHPAVMVDLAAMNRVLEVNAEDMYVTVEGGCTWQALHEALEGTGLRTPYWGTLSGRFATVGGGLSQNSIFWGSGRYGTAADSVLSMDVVLADGTVVTTGAAAQRNGTPFFRHFGPDLTGLFTSDCGALGIKATATLRLVPELPERAYASFAFDRYQEMAPAMAEIARADCVFECFGFDPFLQRQRMKRESMSKDVHQLAGVMKSAGGVGKALKAGARLAFEGRRFMEDVEWSFHVMIEERTGDAAKAALKTVRDIVEKHGGKELPDSIPRLVRSNPFGPVNNMLGPEGERWVPVHGLVPHSKAVETVAACEALFERNRAVLERHDIHTGYLLATVSTHGFVIEPVFFWPDAIEEIHRRSVEAKHLEHLKGFDANPEARAEVTRLKGELADLFRDHGAVHLQVGKAYHYADGLKPEAFALVKALKQVLDPEGRMNPGCLGL